QTTAPNMCRASATAVMSGIPVRGTRGYVPAYTRLGKRWLSEKSREVMRTWVSREGQRGFRAGKRRCPRGIRPSPGSSQHTYPNSEPQFLVQVARRIAPFE